MRALSQVPSFIETKYEVVLVSVGVEYVSLTSPVIDVPPVEVVCQRYSPLAPPEAFSVALALAQMVALVAVGTGGVALMEALTGARVALSQPLMLSAA